jgi:hypothetical protein
MDELTTFSQKLVGDVSVCYSGGLDSTSVALMALAQGKGRVHLHTLRHGYGYLFYYWVGKTVRTLREAVDADLVVHRYVPTRDLFDRVAMKSLRADRRTYGQWFGCCLGCTMALVTKIIIYNLENQVPHIVIGSSVGGQYAVMSTPRTVKLLKAFCAQYGILYSTPLLDDNIVKSRERAFLEANGVFRGHRFLDKHSFGNQGYCLLSLQHLPDVLLNVHPSYDLDQVERFFLDKQPLCEQYIRDHFASDQGKLDALSTALKKRTGLT